MATENQTYMKQLTSTQMAIVSAIHNKLGEKTFFEFLAIRRLELKMNENLQDFGVEFTLSLSDFTKNLKAKFPKFLEAVDTFLDYTDHKSEYELVDDIKHEKNTVKKGRKNRANKPASEPKA